MAARPIAKTSDESYSPLLIKAVMVVQGNYEMTILWIYRRCIALDELPIRIRSLLRL